MSRVAAFIAAGIVGGVSLFIGSVILADSLGPDLTATLLICMAGGGLLGVAASLYPVPRR